MTATIPASFASEGNVAHLESEYEAAKNELASALEGLNAIKDRVSACRGRNVDPRTWSDLLDRQRIAGQRHQRAARRAGELREQAKCARIALDARKREEAQATDRTRQLGFAEHFMNTARELLDPDVFAGLMQEATLRRNRELVPVTPNRAAGAAMGVRGSAGGMRERKP